MFSRSGCLLSKRLQVSSRHLIPTNSTRFGSTLAFIETNHDGTLSGTTLKSLGAAVRLGNPIVGLAMGSRSRNAIEALKLNYKCAQLSKILVVEDVKYDNTLAEYVSPVIAELMESSEFTHFVISSSSTGKNVLPRVGALLDLQPIVDITKINSETEFERPIYAGNILATVRSNEAKQLISVRVSSFPNIDAGSMPDIAVESFNPKKDVEVPENIVENVDMFSTNRPDLSTAKVIVTGGRGLKDKETFDKLITPLADILHAGIGATRAAVDNGFCENSLQIGQTGKIVAPDLYIAAGVSGAIQHLAGIKDSGTIVAINSDADAPIFKNSDIGLKGDLLEILPAMTEKLKQ